MDITNLIKQAQKIKSEIDQKQADVSKKVFLGVSGGGIVTVEIYGSGKAKSVKIADKALGEDVLMLQDLIVAAFNAAKENMDRELKETLSSVAGGMGANIFGNMS